jgi:hypothetical protein
MRNITFTSPERRAKPLWGLLNAKTGVRYKADAEKFIDAHPRGSCFESDELLAVCQNLFPDWFTDEPDLKISDCTGRLNAGGYRLEEKVFRIFFDRSSFNYVVMGPLELIDNIDLQASIATTAQSKLALIDSLLQSAQVELAALPEEVQQKLIEVYDIHHKKLVDILTQLARDASLTLQDIVNGGNQLSNGGSRKALKR